MPTTTKKTMGKRTKKKKTLLPPSADVVKISGREYIIAPLDEFQEWEEERALAALMSKRLDEAGPYLSWAEFEKRLDRKTKGQKK